jgi:hypothetical protein
VGDRHLKFHEFRDNLRTRRQAAMTGTPARFNRKETHAIREWARQNGHQPSDRGRIPKSVIETYQAAS